MQSNEIETKARELYEQNNPNWRMERNGEWHYISNSRKHYYQQIALDELNKTKTPKEQIIEIHTGKSIEDIEENNRIVKELVTNKKNQIKITNTAINNKTF